MTQITEERVLTREALTTMRANGDAFILVDVLSHEHFTQRHIPGAINVPLSILRDLATLLFSREDTIVVYCADYACSASVTAGKVLTKLGFTHIYEYRGGLKEWEEAGLPMTRQSQTAASGV